MLSDSIISRQINIKIYQASFSFPPVSEADFMISGVESTNCCRYQSHHTITTPICDISNQLAVNNHLASCCACPPPLKMKLISPQDHNPTRAHGFKREKWTSRCDWTDETDGVHSLPTSPLGSQQKHKEGDWRQWNSDTIQSATGRPGTSIAQTWPMFEVSRHQVRHSESQV